jgi:hypothetical protein
MEDTGGVDDASELQSMMACEFIPAPEHDACTPNYEDGED